GLPLVAQLVLACARERRPADGRAVDLGLERLQQQLDELVALHPSLVHGRPPEAASSGAGLPDPALRLSYVLLATRPGPRAPRPRRTPGARRAAAATARAGARPAARRAPAASRRGTTPAGRATPARRPVAARAAPARRAARRRPAGGMTSLRAAAARSAAR